MFKEIIRKLKIKYFRNHEWTDGNWPFCVKCNTDYTECIKGVKHVNGTGYITPSYRINWKWDPNEKPEYCDFYQIISVIES